ncbi:DUF3237 domain-containing protein [Luminiphilus sp.]|jgi:hypothetical protein|nr:DUF3237 domain-containing protein [Halieaceae bacterium]MDA7585252.1 DUF3237 domain-containing protein [Luminiphilus sp.]MDA7840039.1 DUF3237 domain-containing protein [Luminiphilus sp.]MDA8660676.1 DUF3237 domain-containing protein [Luminiphilus sp.]MDA9581091.1 DUF3237 domain-containing protein [Luminiphilus sp.]
MQPKATLKFMATLTAQLGDQIVVGDGPKGSRVVIDVPSVSLVGDKINASLATHDAADWLTLSEDGQLGALDVRMTLKTDDDAFIYVEYQGRANMQSGVIATAPTFQTSHEKYLWLNRIQAVAAGQLDSDGKLVYSLYEVVVES